MRYIISLYIQHTRGLQGKILVGIKTSNYRINVYRRMI